MTRCWPQLSENTFNLLSLWPILYPISERLSSLCGGNGSVVGFKILVQDLCRRSDLSAGHFFIYKSNCSALGFFSERTRRIGIKAPASANQHLSIKPLHFRNTPFSFINETVLYVWSPFFKSIERKPLPDAVWPLWKYGNVPLRFQMRIRLDLAFSWSSGNRSSSKSTVVITKTSCQHKFSSGFGLLLVFRIIPWVT